MLFASWLSVDVLSHASTRFTIIVKMLTPKVQMLFLFFATAEDPKVPPCLQTCNGQLSLFVCSVHVSFSAKPCSPCARNLLGY